MRPSPAGWLLLVVVQSLTACEAAEDPPQPTLSGFCAAVDRAPKDETSVARTLAAAIDVEQNSPPAIRAEVTTLREAVEAVSTVKEMEALTESGPVRAASRKYHAYIEEHCQLY